MLIAFLDLIDDYEEKERFKELYNTYRGLMAHIARTKASSYEDVEDILQDTFFYIIAVISFYCFAGTFIAKAVQTVLFACYKSMTPFRR